jgi:hypothetical protein
VVTVRQLCDGGVVTVCQLCDGGVMTVCQSCDGDGGVMTVCQSCDGALFGQIDSCHIAPHLVWVGVALVVPAAALANTSTVWVRRVKYGKADWVKGEMLLGGYAAPDALL